MATYTSNLNLYMPDSTDDFGEFREEHNDNMVKIDNAIGGGGGSGGHTIVNPSGSDMPAEGKLQFTGGVTVTDDSVNGKTVVDISGGGVGGNVYGAFIDTNRVIASGSYSSSYSYTATEDCYLFFTCGGTTSSSGKLYLEGNLIRYIFVNNSDNNYGDGIYLKKGQTAEVQSPQAGTFQYIVYGLTQGTDSIFTPIIYSDTERVVGVWRDNKPLYQRTFVLPNPIDVLYNSWTSMGVSVADGERIVRCEGVDNTDGLFNPLMAYFNNSVIECQTPRNNSNAWQIKYLSVWYTKTTDVAGSGNWNTDGVPTVHYSTSEQVIGTWIDGKPIYQKSVEIGTVNGGSGKNVAHGIADFKRLVGHECVGYNTAESAWNILSKVDNDASYQREFKVNATNITIDNSANSQTFTDVVATIRYTKVTD